MILKKPLSPAHLLQKRAKEKTQLKIDLEYCNQNGIEIYWHDECCFSSKNFLKTDCVLHRWGPEKTNWSGITCSCPSRLAPLNTIPSPTFSGIYIARAPFRAVGCTSMCVDKVCSLNVAVLVSSFSVILINPQQSPETAIYPHIGCSVCGHVQRPSHMDPQSSQASWVRGRPPH